MPQGYTCRENSNETKKTTNDMPSPLVENITPPIVDSFSSHGSQFKFREWCETEPTGFRSYPRDKNVRPFITDLNQRQKNS